MTALVRMRLAAFVRGGRALPPIIAALVVLGVIHGGGASAAAPAYGYSAIMLFPVLAWTTKLVLDEPWEGLDSAARTLIPDIVAEVTDAGGAVLVSDHRGEIAGLPGATRWTVADSTVRTAPPGAPDEVIVEVAVRRADADGTVARLRADGHRVLRVRDDDRLPR